MSFEGKVSSTFLRFEQGEVKSPSDYRIFGLFATDPVVVVTNQLQI